MFKSSKSAQEKEEQQQGDTNASIAVSTAPIHLPVPVRRRAGTKLNFIPTPTLITEQLD